MMGATLKALRKQRGVTQTQLASFLSLDKSTIAKYETAGVTPSKDILIKLADYFSVSVDYLMGRTDDQFSEPILSGKGIKIPVLGRVQAGLPVEAVEDVIDYEEITPQLAKTGDFFALQIRGDSMDPFFTEGDIVVVRKQPDVENGEIAIVRVNGDDATIKKLVKYPSGLSLVPHNANYSPLFFTWDDVAALPVEVIGKVIELRRKF